MRPGVRRQLCVVSPSLTNPPPSPQVPKHHIQVIIKQQEVACTLLDQEADKFYERQNEVADELQRLLGGKRRLSDEALKAGRHDKTKSDAAVRLSIDYCELDVRITKRQEVIERKKTLVAKLKVLVEGNRGIMKDELNSALYMSLKTKKGGLTDEQRLQRKWLMLDDEPVAEPAVAVVAVGGAFHVGAGAGAAPVAPQPPAAASAVRITKTGEPDKRFARS